MPRKFRQPAFAILALGASLALAACDGKVRWSSNGFDGVPLDELDMSAEAPTGVSLAGPDRVIISEGTALDISVDADAEIAERLRFNIEDGVLGIGRENGDWSDMGSSSAAIIRVTMPTPETLAIAGSGRIEAAKVAGDATLEIAGSGKIAVAEIDAGTLNIDIAGKGSVTGSGTTEMLAIDIAGSGEVSMEALKAGDATIDIAGSGDAIFSSDGTVKAGIAGSGDVTVIGNATCSVETAGSGSLTCRPAAEPAETDAG